MSASASLIVELEEAIERGDIKRRLTTLTRITDLFAGRANVYSEEQIALFDEVILRLAADIETQARVMEARVRLVEAKAKFRELGLGRATGIQDRKNPDE